MGAEYTVHP